MKMNQFVVNYQTGPRPGGGKFGVRGIAVPQALNTLESGYITPAQEQFNVAHVWATDGLYLGAFAPYNPAPGRVAFRPFSGLNAPEFPADVALHLSK
jgi:hypothetical protein